MSDLKYFYKNQTVVDCLFMLANTEIHPSDDVELDSEQASVFYRLADCLQQLFAVIREGKDSAAAEALIGELDVLLAVAEDLVRYMVSVRKQKRLGM